jgi:hypothetical protein
MAFQLKVTFSGLNLFLVHEDGPRVAVLQPDCRWSETWNPTHVDNTVGIAHVGYLRFNLANLVDGLPDEVPGSPPRYEGVYRFNGEALSFNLPAGEVTGTSGLPMLKQIAPDGSGGALLVPRDGLFGANPPSLLMRTILPGGTLNPDSAANWEFTQTIGNGNALPGVWAAEVIWTRQVDDLNELVLTFSNLSGTQTRELTLRPTSAGGDIHLKIANLCATDPLEWGEFDPTEPISEDRDFKWLYRLLEPKSGTWADLQIPPRELPFPSRRGGVFGSEGCIGMEATGSGF